MLTESESVYLGASRDTWERVRGVTRSQNFDQNEPKYYCKAVSSKFPTEINETVVLGTIRSNFEGLWATGSIFQVAAPEARDWSRTRSGAYRGGRIERFPRSSIDVETCISLRWLLRSIHNRHVSIPNDCTYQKFLFLWFEFSENP